jgi:KDO2-lipid IV(A) lauroyltransferase
MAKRGKVQTWVEYAVARAIFGGLSMMPASWAMKTGRQLGRVAYIAAGHLRRTGDRNLKLAFPEKTEDERQQLLRECFAGLGRQLGLFSKFAGADRQKLLDLTRWEGLEHLAAAKAKNKPVILFTGHVGAWELSSFGLSLRGSPLSFLVRRIDNPKVEELVDRTRMRFGNQSVDKRGAARPMLNILRSGGTLGLLVDLNTLDEEAIFVDFFGVPASTTFMVAKLALRTDATVLPIFVPWDNDSGKFLVHILPEVDVERTGEEEDVVRELTAHLTQVVENYIRRYPDQWLWIHKRWKTRPKGEPDLYQ